jgi:hypothetical protein
VLPCPGQTTLFVHYCTITAGGSSVKCHLPIGISYRKQQAKMIMKSYPTQMIMVVKRPQLGLVADFTNQAGKHPSDSS